AAKAASQAQSQKAGKEAASADATPIDLQTRMVGGKAVPLLSGQWVSEMRCIAYTPPPPPMSSQPAEDAWQERCQYLIDDLTELLRLPHWRFWCQLLNDRSVSGVMLDSYLRLAPRWFDPDLSLFSQIVRDTLQRLHRLVFFVCLRLATHRECATSCISESAFPELHSRINLFNPPRLMDICALYWRTNQTLVSKMIANLLKRLPNLARDLTACLSGLGSKVLQDSISDLPASAIADEASSKPFDFESVVRLSDRILFARDALETLDSLFGTIGSSSSASSASSTDVLSGAELESVLPRLYEALVPAAQEKLRLTAAARAAPLEQQRVMDTARRAAHRLHSLCLSLYHRLWLACPQAQTERAHNLLMSLSQLIHCRRFLAALESNYGIVEELRRLRDVDPELADYTVEAVTAALSELGESAKSVKQRTNGAGAAGTDAAINYNSDYDDADDSSDDDNANEDAGTAYLTGQTSGIVNSAFTADAGDTDALKVGSRPDEVQMESLVSHVQDILPGIGSGFIKECLRYYSFDPERLINALLEDSLPPVLNSLDRSLLTAPYEAAEASAASAAAAATTMNDFNFSQPNRLDREALRGRIHRGKREKSAAIDELEFRQDAKMREWLDDWERRLRDTEEAEAEAEAIAQAEAARVAGIEAAIAYEDEYDDTYDGAAMAPDAAGSDDEERQLQRQPQPQQMQPAPQQQQQQQQQQRFDVRGSGKRGRGQSHQVVHNRQVKDRDKGRRANHNRRQLSDRKHAGGMF
ncbi:hypothetical protein BOX15_Mlig016038g1, partial [Macrostomum lignano]